MHLVVIQKLPESKRPGTVNYEFVVYVEALFSSADMLYPCQSVLIQIKGPVLLLLLI
jgi:hypothetical protein